MFVTKADTRGWCTVETSRDAVDSVAIVDESVRGIQFPL